MKLKIPAEIYKPYGEKLGGTNTGDPSCTLNGYTWARNVKVVRVFRFSDRHLPENGAELYQEFDGKEVLRGMYNSDLKVFFLYNERVKSMRKGLFAKYKGNIYQAKILSNSLINLVSSEVKDKELGFKLKVYPEYYKDVKNLPKLYLKDVNRDDIIELFEVYPKSRYKGHEFNVSREKNGNVNIGTIDAALAKILGFERTDKYYYEKWVPKNEVTIFEERKEIKL